MAQYRQSPGRAPEPAMPRSGALPGLLLSLAMISPGSAALHPGLLLRRPSGASYPRAKIALTAVTPVRSEGNMEYYTCPTPRGLTMTIIAAIRHAAAASFALALWS